MKKFLLMFLCSVAFAGTNNLPVEVGPVVQLQHINKFQSALVGDFVPRNSLGNVGDTTGDLGTTVYRWKNLFTKSVSLQNDLTGNAVVLKSNSGLPVPIDITLFNSLPLGTSNVTIDQTGQLSHGSPTIGSTVVSGASGVTPFNFFFQNPIMIPNSSVSLKTYGRPVIMMLTSTSTATGIGSQFTGGFINFNSHPFGVLFYIDGNPVSLLSYGVNGGSQAAEPCSAFQHFAPLTPGVHTFSAWVEDNTPPSPNSNTLQMYNCALAVYEI